MSSVAWAGDVVARADDHGKLVRVVLEWPDAKMPPAHVRSVDDRTVEITFDASENFTPFHPIVGIPEIVDIRNVTGADGKLKLWVMQAGPLYKKDIQVGNRLLLDFGQSLTLRDQAARATKAAQADLPAKTNDPVVTKMPDVAPPVVEAAPVSAAAPVEVTLDTVNPPVVTLSSVSNFGVATFLDAGHLWIVVDTPHFTAQPQLSGKDAAKLGAFKKIETDEATIFYVPVPPSLKAVRAEGGGLHWRVVLAPPKGDARPLDPQRVEENKERRLFWPMTGVTKIIPFNNPLSGDDQIVVTVKESTEFTGPARAFAEFSTVPTYAGLVVVPGVDDLKVDTKNNGILISRPHGLNVTSELDASTARPVLAPPPTPAETKKEVTQDVRAVDAPHASEPPAPELSSMLYRFDRWSMGGASSLRDNETALIADLVDKREATAAGGLMDIGKMYLANGRGAEALGYFRLALDSEANLAETPEYLGLRGAAYVVNGQYDLGYEDLRLPALDQYPDVAIWRAYTLAHLQDWPQALEKMPGNIDVTRTYPPEIGDPMRLMFAEIALRGGKIGEAGKLLAGFAPAAGTGKDDKEHAVDSAPIDDRMMHVQAQRDYLMGEAARQLGQKDNARSVWEKLLTSADDKYRTRARLALTVMNYEDGKIAPELAIDNLEGLRYVWRGDDLETAVNARLGDMYLEHGDYLRGLNVLKDAASFSPDSDAGRKITADMSEAFRSIFIGDRAAKVDPLDAITVYEKFSELVPPGDEGTKLTLALVDRLMSVDLLDRATVVLQDLVDHRLVGAEKVKAGLRLAAVHLMNNKPKEALTTLNRTEGMLSGITAAAQLDGFKHEMNLLRARTLFQSGQVDAALSLLDSMAGTADVLRARADIAWQTARWSDAMQALRALLALDPPAMDKPPTLSQAEIIRNVAVATNLSGDRASLAQLRSDYMDLMLQTDFAKEFDVITRARQVSTLADRDTLNKVVGETDIFGGFLDTYKRSEKTPAPAAALTLDTQAAAPTPNPPSGQ